MSALLLGLALAILPACATEDSSNCVWDAQTMGNGTGTSFIDVNGTTYDLPNERKLS